MENSQEELKLSARPAQIHLSRCLRQRHAEASCTYCMNACPEGAIAIEDSSITIDEVYCIGCGVCLVACPVEVFVTEVWSERNGLHNINAIKTNRFEIVCAYHTGPEQGILDVPVIQISACLAAMSPGIWFEMGLKHEVSIRLDTCADCQINSCEPIIRKAISLANKWLVTRQQQVTLLILDKEQLGEADTIRPVISAEKPLLTRRDLIFGFARSGGLATLGLTCLPELCDEAEMVTGQTSPHIPSWLKRLADIYPDDKEPCKHVNWPYLYISPNCTSCGVCADYCPSGALTTEREDQSFNHRFTPGLCVDCGLCAQVCPSEALIRIYASIFQPFVQHIINSKKIKACERCGRPANLGHTLCYWCEEEPPIETVIDDAKKFLLSGL